MKHLLFLHGWAADGRIWDRQRVALEGRAQIWAPDIPVWDAGWLQDQLRSFDPAHTILVGWSLGGMLALEAVAAGFKPQTLITIAACASFCRRPDFALGLSGAVVRGMRQRLRQEAPAVVQDFYRQLLAAEERQHQEDLEGLLPSEQDPVWLAQGLKYLGAKDLRQQLPAVKAGNVVVVHGDRDRIIAPAQAYFLQEQVPGARLLLLPGAGHVPMVTRSQQLNALIMECL